MNDELNFKNGKFKIMQIADTQEKVQVNPDTIKLIRLAVEREKPDLVVFTGDQIMGYSSSFKKDAMNAVERTVKEIIKPIAENNIPFCVTFGNHDRDCGIDNNTQMNKIYKKLPGFICGECANDYDTGTYSLQIKSSDKSKIAFNLYIIDSNAKEANGVYSPVRKEQVEWYRNERERLKNDCGSYVPSLVFQHIPLPEFYDIIKRCSRFKKGAVEAFYSHSNEFYVLDDETIRNGGFMHESPAAPDINNGEFEAMKEKGEVLGIFVGHDHINSFSKKLDGIVLGYTQGCGFNTYGPGAQRGVRIFELDESDLSSFSTRTLTMNMLCHHFKPSEPAKEFILTHSPSSVKQIKGIVIKALAGCSAIAATAFILKKYIAK
ncbi:MAG: metallophosphoesterase family protein [Acutalibacteraceae bacterium]